MERRMEVSRKRSERELQGVHLFRDITEEELNKMLSCSRAKEAVYDDQCYIFRQGEVPQRLFVILDGTVMIAKDFPSGKRDVLFLVEKGDVFGEMFLFSDEKSYWYDAVAQGRVRVLEIPWDFFYGFCRNACEHHQMITRNMLEIQSQKNFFMTRKLHLLSGTTLRERIALWLLEQAGDKNVVSLTMNREELADYIGTTRPSLSRELMKMQQEQLIEVDKRKIRLLNREALEQIY